MEKENKFVQLCVWPGTVLGDSTPDELVQFFKDELNTRIKFDCEVETLPDLDSSGNPVPDTGGRKDLFFYAHSDDLEHFSIPRLSMGIRWWEDVISYNEGSKHLYTAEFIEARPITW